MTANTDTMMLVDIAYARSGDKGDVSNIGVLAKDSDAYEHIKETLTPQRIAEHFSGWVGSVEVYDMPNIEGVMVVLRKALGGGATTTLRIDQTGKAMACNLLRMRVPDRSVRISRAEPPVAVGDLPL
jgi:hypothetical protein